MILGLEMQQGDQYRSRNMTYGGGDEYPSKQTQLRSSLHEELSN